MNILHYTLGLPPERTGGMTKYATDLMTVQSKSDDVFLLYPGRNNRFSNKRIICTNAPYRKIRVYEICNPVMMPLLYGIANPSDILDDKKGFRSDILQKFYDEVRPDIFHIHTWMGMPPELMLFFKSKGVNIVYTSHDYYGLCAKVNFINEEGKLCPQPSEQLCSKCNAQAPPKVFLKLRNTHFLLKLKNLTVLRQLIKR